MVLADDTIAVPTRTVGHDRVAMRAHVQESVIRAVFIANEKGPAKSLKCEEVPAVWRICGTTDTLPTLPEQLVQLAVIVLEVAVQSWRECVGQFDVMDEHLDSRKVIQLRNCRPTLVQLVDKYLV